MIFRDAGWYPSNRYSYENMDRTQARERLLDLKEIVNDKYVKAIEEAISAMDANMNYIHIIETLIMELQAEKNK